MFWEVYGLLLVIQKVVGWEKKICTKHLWHINTSGVWNGLCQSCHHPPWNPQWSLTPLHAAERWLGIFGTCMALLTGSLFISVLTNTMAEVARERTRTTKILQAVRRYCHTYSISYAYTRQMKRYVEREHRRNEIQCHMSLLQTLPEGMVRELFQEARSGTLHAHAFFKEIGLSDRGMELNLCSQAVNELYYLAGDVIFDTTSKAEGPIWTRMDPWNIDKHWLPMKHQWNTGLASYGFMMFHGFLSLQFDQWNAWENIGWINH